MKVELITMSDDTFTLQIETTSGVDPTAAEADFISQIIETALPDTPVVQPHLTREELERKYGIRPHHMSLDGIELRSGSFDTLAPIQSLYTADQAAWAERIQHIEDLSDDLADEDDERGPQLIEDWAAAVVDIVAGARGIKRDVVLRALAEELNKRGITSEIPVKLKGGAWKDGVPTPKDLAEGKA